MGNLDKLIADLDLFGDGAKRDPDPTDTSPTREVPNFEREWSDDPVVQQAQVLALMDGIETDNRAAVDAWLGTEIERIETSGRCCGDGPHFDRNGVLQAMLELNTNDVDAAWKAWHDFTIKPDVRFMTVEDAAEELGDRLAAKEKHKIRREVSDTAKADHKKGKWKTELDKALDDILAV